MNLQRIRSSFPELNGLGRSFLPEILFKVEATQVSINGWVDEQNVVYACNGILFSLKKKCYNIDEP